MRLFITMLIAFTIVAAGARAQELAPKVYDLQAVLEQTAAANPTIKAAAADVAIARTQVNEAAAHGKPRVQGQLGYLQLDKDPTFSVVGMGTMTFGETSNTIANVSMEWPIYTGGMITAMKRAARLGVDASLQGYERAKQETLAEAAVAYYQALSARHMVTVMREQVTTLQEAVRIATALHQQGMVAKLDVLRPQADLSAAQATLAQAENGAQVALTNLKRLMNLPRETPLALAESEVPLERPADMDAAVTAALAQRPEVAQLAKARQATEAQRAAAKAEMRPRVGLQVQYDFDRPSTYPNIGDWSAGIMLQQAFSDGGASRARANRADAQLAQLQAQEEALRQGITTQVTNALLTLRTADRRVEATTVALNAAQEAYRFAEMSYKNQVVPIIDVLAAQTALTNARTQSALARFERLAAAVQLQLALGQTPGVRPNGGVE